MPKVVDRYQLGDFVRANAIGKQVKLADSILRFKNDGIYLRKGEEEITFPFELEEDTN